jgi:hypothetical protein
MMKWIFSLLFVVCLFAEPSCVAQVAIAGHPCTGPQGISSIPSQTFNDFMAAHRMTDRQGAIKKEIEVAKRPGSGMKVPAEPTVFEGKITFFEVTVASAPKCILDMIPFNPGQRRPSY